MNYPDSARGSPLPRDEFPDVQSELESEQGNKSTTSGVTPRGIRLEFLCITADTARKPTGFGGRRKHTLDLPPIEQRTALTDPEAVGGRAVRQPAPEPETKNGSL